MPRLSDELWNERRRHVLESAFRCFARNGFHATTMDEVIAESGLSTSVVYRYVRGGKDELIAASIEETLTQLSRQVDDLLALDPVPTPREAVQAFVAGFDDAAGERGYPLTSLVIQTWAEALRSPAIAERARLAWRQERHSLTALADRWHDLGHLPESYRSDDVASMLSVMAIGLLVDVAHLGGDATRGVLRRMDTLTAR